MYSCLDQVFKALADSTRRGILDQLMEGQQNLKSLAARYSMSQPAFSKHVGVLEKAGLVRKVRRGRETFLSVQTEPLDEAGSWLNQQTRFWEERFDRMELYLKEKGKNE